MSHNKQNNHQRANPDEDFNRKKDMPIGCIKCMDYQHRGSPSLLMMPGTAELGASGQWWQKEKTLVLPHLLQAWAREGNKAPVSQQTSMLDIADRSFNCRLGCM
jgi:hypothetical protein